MCSDNSFLSTSWLLISGWWAKVVWALPAPRRQPPMGRRVLSSRDDIPMPVPREKGWFFTSQLMSAGPSSVTFPFASCDNNPSAYSLLLLEWTGFFSLLLPCSLPDQFLALHTSTLKMMAAYSETSVNISNRLHRITSSRRQNLKSNSSIQFLSSLKVRDQIQEVVLQVRM
jgi:hypothetical protein